MMTSARVMVTLAIGCCLLARSAAAERKDPGTAVAWAVGPALAGAGLAAYASEATGSDRRIAGAAAAVALIVGPGAGHLYAGETGRGGASIGARALALFAASAGVQLARDGDEEMGNGLLVAGSLGFAATVVADVLDAPSAARRAGDHPRDAEPRVRVSRRPLFVAIGATACAAALIGVGAHAAARTDDRDRRWLVVAPGLAALAIAPSAGHVYAGEHRRGAVSSIVRGVAIGVGAYGVASFHLAGNDDPVGSGDNVAIPMALVTVAASTVLGTTVADWVDASEAARRRITVTPAVLPGRAPGLVVAGSF